VSLERGSLSLLSTIKELLERKLSGFGLENHDYGSGNPPRWPRDTPLYPLKFTLTSPTGGRRSVGIVSSRTQATELLLTIIQEVKNSQPLDGTIRSITLFISTRL
jgi:hypothetical protein